MFHKKEPSIVSTLRSANPKLLFLGDCLKYKPEERPAATFITRGLQQCVMESKSNQISNVVLF